MTNSENIEIAIQLFQSNRIEESKNLVEEYLASYPKDINANLLSAAISASEADYVSVSDKCKNILDIDPTNLRACINGAVASEKLEQYHDVLMFSNRVLDQEPKNIQARLYRLIGMCNTGDEDESITECCNLILDNKNSVELIDKIVQIYSTFSADVLHKIFIKVLDVDNCNMVVLSKLVTLSAATGEIARAEEYIATLNSVDKNNINSIAARAKLLYYQNRYSDFINLVESLSEQEKSEIPEVKMDLANCYMAISEYEKALDIFRHNINSGYRVPESYHNIGIIEDRRGNLDDSIKAYESVININSGVLTSHYNLAFLYNKKGNKSRALQIICNCLNIQDSPRTRQAFVEILSTASRDNITDDIEILIVDVVSDDVTDAQTLSSIIWAYLKEKSPAINNLATMAFEDNYAEFSRLMLISSKEIIDNKLLSIFLSNIPITNYEFESFVKMLRRYLMVDSVNEVDEDRNLYEMYISIATRCYIDGYPFLVTDEELTVLNSRLSILTENDAITYGQLLQILMYVSLYELYVRDNSIAERFDLTSASKSLIKLQLDDNLAEKKLRSSIESISIDDATSLAVQDQYESNPYPVWQILDTREPEPISQIIQKVSGYSESTLPVFTKPDILIAGCGTGSHAIQTHMRINHRTLTAIDLSKSSLAFAKRKAGEYGFSDIVFNQLDILKVAKLNKKFDIVESVGVLHHMQEPLQGLRSLVDVLNQDGLMNIGLYSKSGRRFIIKAKSIYDDVDRYVSDDEIRQIRTDIMNSSDIELKANISGFKDFYALHNCRDLVFHENENNYHLSEISELLEEAGLQFIGFDLLDASVSDRFKKMFPESGALSDLKKWNIFEQKYPDTFASMYIFWCKKK